MNRFGYPPSARLRRPADFALLRREAKRIPGGAFHGQYRVSAAGQPRLGTAISRRVSKRAVVRNRIRRIVRESFRLHRGRLPPCDVLLIATSAAAEQPVGALRDELQRIWNRLAALKAPGPDRTIPDHS